MITYRNYVEGNKTITDEPRLPSLPLTLKELEITYDGGRLSIFINNEAVYENLSAGNDFSVEIE